LILHSRACCAIPSFKQMRAVLALVIHTHHEYRVDAPFLQWERNRQREDSFPQTNTQRISLDRAFPAVPNGARVVERLKHAIPILDGIVDHPVTTGWIDAVLVPSP